MEWEFNRQAANLFQNYQTFTTPIDLKASELESAGRSPIRTAGGTCTCTTAYCEAEEQVSLIFGC